jgi:hypothetical protein
MDGPFSAKAEESTEAGQLHFKAFAAFGFLTTCRPRKFPGISQVASNDGMDGNR